MSAEREAEADGRGGCVNALSCAPPVAVRAAHGDTLPSRGGTASSTALQTNTASLRDNDAAYGQVFRNRLRTLGIRDHPTAPRSPWQNGHAERLIGSIRRECLDHIIILNAAAYSKRMHYYNSDRTHLALAKDAPNSRPVECTGRIDSRPILGGLHHRYRRVRRK